MMYQALTPLQLSAFNRDTKRDAYRLDLGRFGLADPYQDLALFLRLPKFNHPQVDAAAPLRTHYPRRWMRRPAGSNG